MKLNILSGILLMAGVTVCQAQENKINPVSLDFFMDNHVWFSSVNAAGLRDSNRLEFSELNLGAALSNGDFRRPQEAKKSTRYLFSALGGLSVGGVYLQGNFNFKQIFDDGVGYTSLLDPYRGTPYQIADSSGGNWRKQQYDMNVKVASPVWFNLFAVGADLKLAVGRGAKKIDPRPLANSNRMDVSPSIAFFPGQHTVGLVFQYRRFREDLDLMLYNSSEHQKLYLLRGIGQYFFETFQTTRRERMYEGSGRGGSLQYSYAGKRLTAFFSGEYMTYEEDAQDIDTERDRPKLVGKLNEKELKGELLLSLKSERLIHKLELTYASIKRNGTEIGQRFEQNDYVTISKAPDRSQYKRSEISADYRLNILKDEGSYAWTFGLRGGYEDYDDSYPVSVSFIRYTRLSITPHVQKNFTFGQKQVLELGLVGCYSRVMKHSMAYNRLNADEDEQDQTILNGLILPDYRYFSQNRTGGGVNAKYAYRLPNMRWMHVAVDANICRSENKDYRNDLFFRIGYLF